MIATVHGILCKVDKKTNKAGEAVPCVYVFTGDETICINELNCNPDSVGCKVSIDCEIKDREFEGRKYKTIRAIELDKEVN